MTPHVLIVEAPYYADIVSELLAGAVAALESAGASHDLLAVPGAFEIPAAIGFAARGAAGQYAGFVALGCVIRGETTHYDYICSVHLLL